MSTLLPIAQDLYKNGVPQAEIDKLLSYESKQEIKLWTKEEILNNALEEVVLLNSRRNDPLVKVLEALLGVKAQRHLVHTYTGRGKRRKVGEQYYQLAIKFDPIQMPPLESDIDSTKFISPVYDCIFIDAHDSDYKHHVEPMQYASIGEYKEDGYNMTEKCCYPWIFISDLDLASRTFVIRAMRRKGYKVMISEAGKLEFLEIVELNHI